MSSSQVPLLARLVAAAVNVSQKSARILREVKKSGELNIKEKEANDYVTRADFLSQLNIIKSLEKMFPKLRFHGEEGDLKEEYTDLETTINEDVLKHANKLPDIYDSLKEEELLVWVDPLDGTKEFTQGPEVAKEVTVLIGVAYNGKPIAGVVNQPFYENDSIVGRVFWGIVGLGAFDLKTGRLPTPQPSADKNRIVTTRSHIDPLIKRDIESIPNSALIHAGGAGYKFITVLEGTSDCYFYPKDGLKRWDTCGPEALLRSMGGKMTDIFGNEYSYNHDSDADLVENVYGAVVCLGNRNDEYVKYVSDELKKRVLDDFEKLKAKKLLAKNN